MNKFFFLFLLILLSSSSVKAIPELPNQFYGDVIYLGDLVSDGHKVTAKIGEEEFTIDILNGKYGITKPFFVRKDSANKISKIRFYIDDKEILTYDYNSGWYTKLNLDIPSNTVVIKKTTVKNLNLKISESKNLLEEFAGIQEIEFEENNKPLAKFDYDFDKHNVKDLLKEAVIKKQEEKATKGAIIIKGVELPLGKTKTVYVDNLNSNDNSVCIKDMEIDSIDEISNTCKGTNEKLIVCNGIEQGNYKCTLTENKYEITGLLHSGVQEHVPVCGDGICDNDETCSSCLQDCGSCPSSPSSSGASSVTCSYVSYNCGAWSVCNEQGHQSRTCGKVTRCGGNLINKIQEEKKECKYERVIKKDELITEELDFSKKPKTSATIPLIIAGILIISVIIYFFIKKRKKK